MASTKQYLLKVKKETYELVKAAAEEANCSISEMGDRVMRIKVAALADSAHKAGTIPTSKLLGGPDYELPKPEVKSYGTTWWENFQLELKQKQAISDYVDSHPGVTKEQTIEHFKKNPIN
jgi:phosphoribosylformylglycinamidine (FGAM) synthase-like enzyme